MTCACPPIKVQKITRPAQNSEQVGGLHAALAAVPRDLNIVPLFEELHNTLARQFFEGNSESTVPWQRHLLRSQKLATGLRFAALEFPQRSCAIAARRLFSFWLVLWIRE